MDVALLKLEMLLACIIHVSASGSRPIVEKERYSLAQAPPPTHMVLLTMNSGTAVGERCSKSMPGGNLLELQLKTMMKFCCITFTIING